MFCAVYTRVSTDNQVEKDYNSCESQEEKIRSFIKSQEKMKVFKVYSDPGFTGANLERPALQEMLREIASPASGARNDGKGIKYVIVYKMDRLTRSPKDFYYLIELFEKYKIKTRRVGIHFIPMQKYIAENNPKLPEESRIFFDYLMEKDLEEYLEEYAKRHPASPTKTEGGG